MFLNGIGFYRVLKCEFPIIFQQLIQIVLHRLVADMDFCIETREVNIYPIRFSDPLVVGPETGILRKFKGVWQSGIGF